MTHQLLAQIVFIGRASEHPKEYLLKNTLATYQLVYNIHTIVSKIVVASYLVGSQVILFIIWQRYHLSNFLSSQGIFLDS